MILTQTLAWLLLGSTVPLIGTVEDAGGKPVAGATVWLGDTHAAHKGPEVIARGETDDQGRFRLDRPNDLTGRGSSWSPTLWAYKPGARIAFVEFKGSLPAADEPVKLVLGPASSATLRVLHPDGWPAQDARVRAAQFNFMAPNPPDVLFERLTATTDAEGRATLDGVGLADLVAVDVTAEGQFVQCLPPDPETGLITLRPVGQLRVRIKADDPKALRGWTINATSRTTEPSYRGPYATHWAREKTSEDGRAEFPPMAEGEVYFNIKPPEGSTYLLEQTPSTSIRPGVMQEVEIPLRKGVCVEGTVREEPGGGPIPGIKVDLATLRTGSRTIEWITTDAQGRYSAIVLPGTVRFSFDMSNRDRSKDYYLPPEIQHWSDFEVKDGEERHEFDPPRLRKATTVHGRVVDEDGKPVVGADLTGYWSSTVGNVRHSSSSWAETDSRGEFLLGGLAPRAEVHVSASTGVIAKSAPVVVRSAGKGGAITLKLVKQPTLSLSGRILGPDNKPLAGASIRVKLRQAGTHFGQGFNFAFEGAGKIRTDSDGRFQTPDRLPIDNDYQIEARAPGCDPADSKWVVPPGREVLDVRLRRSVGIRAVAGRVVDSAGKPVAGVEVFQSGDGPRRIIGQTDGDGRFHLPGLPNSPAFVFASKEGYRFIGRRVDPGDPPTEFSIRRLDEPATPLGTAGPAVPRDEERAIARALIAETRAATSGENGFGGFGQLSGIAALVDPDRAIGMIENQVLKADSALLTDLATARSETDAKGCFAILDAIGEPFEAATVALNLFDRLAGTIPLEAGRELLDRDERSARAIREPGQSASFLARIADRRLDLGQVEPGSKLAREAQALAEKPRDQQYPDPSEDVVNALARVDLPVALKFLRAWKFDQRHTLDTLRSGIAIRIATTNPAEARRLIGEVDEPWRPTTRRNACLRMATRDLRAARALAAEGKDPMLEALLPAAAARAVEQSDPDAARKLLLDSVERLAQLDTSRETRPSSAVALASLLPLAIRIDPDRAPGYFWLAISRRPPLSSLPEPGPVIPSVRQHYLDLAELAVLIGRYDRRAAEAVFAPMADRLVGLHDEYWGLGGEGAPLYAIAGAFNARLANDLLQALPEDPQPADHSRTGNNFRHHSKAEARIALARSLALPPALRIAELHQPWMPDLLGFLDK